MSEILEPITGMLPVYRILNREENLNFFRNVLGLKVHLEEGAMVWLGVQTSKASCFLLEESPGVRSVNGAKKHGQTTLVAPAKEVTQLLSKNLAQVSKIYTDGTAYAFETRSPENDHFLICSEGLSALTEMDKSQFTAVPVADFAGLSDVKIKAIDFNVTDTALLDFLGHLLSDQATSTGLDFKGIDLRETVKTGSDLNAASDETLDMEFLMFTVADAFDLTAFAQKFKEENGYYLDKSGRTFSIEAPNNMDIWFVKI